MPAVTGWWEEQVVNAKPAPAVLTVIGGTPVVLVGGGPIRPAPAVLTVTGGVPVVAAPRTVTPAPAALVFTGGSPVVTVERAVRPSPAELVVTGGVPVVLTPVVIRPAAAELVITGGIPALDGSIELRPAGAELAVTGGVPAIRVSDHKVIQPAAANIIITGGTPTVASVGPSAAVITLGSLVTGSPYGRVNVDGIQGATVIAALCGYYSSYNSLNLRCNGAVLPVASQENAGNTSLTDLKVFQGKVNSASGTWLIDPTSGYNSSYNSDCAVVVSGHTSITPQAAVVLPTGTSSRTITPPAGGYSVVFIALQWGSNPDTTVSASGVTVVNDLRSTYPSVHVCVISTETTLSISPAVLSGRSAGLLKQIDVY